MMEAIREITKIRLILFLFAPYFSFVDGERNWTKQQQQLRKKNRDNKHEGNKNQHMRLTTLRKNSIHFMTSAHIERVKIKWVTAATSKQQQQQNV